MIALGVIVVAFRPTRADIVLDNFNRADSSSLGAGWTEVGGGSIGITGDRAEGVVNESLATFNGQTSSTVIIDAFAPTSISTGYVAAVLGFADSYHSLFIKVQDNGGGTQFTNFGFYFGNNGFNNGAWSGSYFGTLTTPFSSGRMMVTLSGTTVTASFDPGFTGTYTQTYTASAVPIGLLGTGIGIGTFGSATLDNFAIPGSAVPVPEPSSLAIAGLAAAVVVASVSWKRRKR